jgi:PAS domain S-box-containing protein
MLQRVSNAFYGCLILLTQVEFYRTTQYGRDYVIGRNCRFLQGPRTNQQCVKRLRLALDSGQEVCETLLNYRRDGTPFFNLLMMAPLHDNKGQVRYFIGAQVDISGLIEEGRGLESFEKYLANRRARLQQERDERQVGKRSTRVSNQSDHTDDTDQMQLRGKQKALKKLKELSEMFSHEEVAVVSSHSQSDSCGRGEDTASVSSQQRRRPHTSHTSRPARRVLIDGSRSDDDDDETDTWALSSFGPSGRLPGVYQSVSLSSFHINLKFLVLIQYSSTSSFAPTRLYALFSCPPPSASQASSSPSSSLMSAPPALFVMASPTPSPQASQSPPEYPGYPTQPNPGAPDFENLPVPPVPPSKTTHPTAHITTPTPAAAATNP